MRKTGILLHISSLPGDYGIGDFGPMAYRFADYLISSGHNIWQILPINHCGYGNSPYNPLSAFALNPLLISPELLYQSGLINRYELQAARVPSGSEVIYELVAKTKEKLLYSASENWLMHNDPEAYLELFGTDLKPYLAFLALCRIYGDSAWNGWNREHLHYSEELFRDLYRKFARHMNVWIAGQAILKEQIHSFKAYLDELGLILVGDMPLYLSYESAEVWAYQHLFDLDEEGRRLHFAGVPPDAFAAEGQLWGNPIYNWAAMEKEGFSLFHSRIGQALEYLDILRLDHFIGYVNYWQVDCERDAEGKPSSPKDARQGKWIDAQPHEFFSGLVNKFGKQRFLAEDLGILTEKVCQVRDSFGFPGMIVLQFCFEESVPEVLNYPADRWLYTCTHDNATTKGWFDALSPDSSSYQNLYEYCRRNRLRDCHTALNSENIHIVMRHIALSTPCLKVIIPMQDILGLDNSARMNIPGTALGNWQWRMTELTDEH